MAVQRLARLARSLSFIKSPDEPVVTALKQAAESGTERDIKRARSLFLKLKSPTVVRRWLRSPTPTERAFERSLSVRDVTPRS